MSVGVSMLSLDEFTQESTQEIEEPNPEENPESHIENRLRLDGVTILLLEDTPDARLYISRLLMRAGARVLCTDSALKAREILANQRPDLIVSDIAMPDEDGLEFMRRLRTDEELTHEH